MIRKTAAITAASIAGVILAGGAAVGANIGILNAADDSPLGELSAQAPIATSSTTSTSTTAQPVVDISDSTDSSQTFTVDVAGTVEVEAGDTGLSLKDVRTNQGWAWQETSTDSGAVMVTFTSGGDTLEFTASANDDGTISAGVDRPFVSPTPTQPQANPSTTYYDDDDDYDDDDGFEYDDDDDDDDDDHEGRDDDD